MKALNSKIGLAALTLAAVLALSGCAGQQKKEQQDAPAQSSAEDANLTPLPTTDGTEGDAIRALQSAGDVVYFDYDRDHIKPEFRELIAAHAAYLRAHPQVQVKLGGHADERGSREYNLALSERRAKAVSDQLMLAGVDRSQLATAAYGEEYPAVVGHSETSWSKNRRVEFEYPSDDERRTKSR